MFLLYVNNIYMGTKERLREFIKYKGISERSFCLTIGVSFSYVNSIRKSIQPDKMKSITALYPELNPIWLITGDGKMLSDFNTNNINGSGNTAVAGDRNKVTNNDIAGMIELQKGYQTIIKEKDDQINRLISIVGKLSER
jgi:transcriptional regulator with XRE-family HTH domain